MNIDFEIKKLEELRTLLYGLSTSWDGDDSDILDMAALLDDIISNLKYEVRKANK